MMTSLLSWFSRTTLLAGVLAIGCGGDGDKNGKKEDDGNEAAEQGDVRLGETAIVTIVNPTPNEGNTAAVPAELSDERAGIEVNAEPGGADTTNEDGLAVVQEVGAEELDLIFGGGEKPVLPFEVMAEGDVYDLAVAYDGESVATFENFPIRYAVGGNVVSFGASASAGSVGDALSEDGFGALPSRETSSRRAMASGWLFRPCSARRTSAVMPSRFSGMPSVVR